MLVSLVMLFVFLSRTIFKVRILAGNFRVVLHKVDAVDANKRNTAGS